MRVETENIPIKRIIDNLSEKVKASPDNVELLHQLARAHAIAYSKKLSDVDPLEVDKRNPDQPWFGYSPPQLPFGQAIDTDNATKQAAAKVHLVTAIALYQKALTAKPDDSTILLGVSWCQDQAGQKQAALSGYRKVAAWAWQQENRDSGGLGEFLYVETSVYLIPLLDKKNDAAEIKEIEARVKKLQALPRPVTPIIVPVSDAITELDQLIDRNARVRFDLDGTGRTLAWPWITRHAAWLVYDPEQSGKVTSAIQMFGNRTFLLFNADGYDALSLLDDNANGIVSGKELSGLALWRDLNANGVSELGEVKPVAEYGITAFSTKHQSHPSGIPFSPQGVTLGEGNHCPSYDVIFKPWKDE